MSLQHFHLIEFTIANVQKLGVMVEETRQLLKDNPPTRIVKINEKEFFGGEMYDPLRRGTSKAIEDWRSAYGDAIEAKYGARPQFIFIKDEEGYPPCFLHPTDNSIDVNTLYLAFEPDAMRRYVPSPAAEALAAKVGELREAQWEEDV